jgi:hypothetical protein
LSQKYFVEYFYIKTFPDIRGLRGLRGLRGGGQQKLPFYGEK